MAEDPAQRDGMTNEGLLNLEDLPEHWEHLDKRYRRVMDLRESHVLTTELTSRRFDEAQSDVQQSGVRIPVSVSR